MPTPFYDPFLTYEENYLKGPFGAFMEKSPLQPKLSEENPQETYLGESVNLPFGIPAGPLLNSNFIKAAFAKGFSLCVYKTVRSGAYPCHPYPNVLAVHPDSDLTLKKAQGQLTANTTYSDPLSITNSFGVPSKDPSIWQEDVKKAITYAGRRQVLILSFMGTVKKGQTQAEFIQDYALAARLAYETKAKVLEVNLSCPNIGNEGLVCYNLDVTRKVCAAIRAEIGNTPLVLKLGYFENDRELEQIAEVTQTYANALSVINTIQTTIVDKKGNQALPGPMRLKSGVCGAAIKWAGLEMVKRLKKIREKRNFTFAIEGVGGVMNVKDYLEYKQAGADSVMSATGAMWNPFLAREIKSNL